MSFYLKLKCFSDMKVSMQFGPRFSIGYNYWTNVTDPESRIIEKEQILSFDKIPTANRLPFIGTKLDFLLAGSGKRLHEYIDKRHRELGSIFREPIGSVEGVFINSPELMRQVFLYEGKYPKHPLPESWLLYNKIHDSKRGLLFMDNDEWLVNRKIMNKILLRNDFFHAKRIIERTSAELIAEWIKISLCDSQEYAEVPNLIDWLYRWSVNVIADIMLGNGVVTSNRSLQILLGKFTENVHQIFEHSAPLMSISPAFVRKLRLKMWTRFEDSVTETLKLANIIIDKALVTTEFSNSNGLIQEMISNGMTIDVIKRIFVDLIIAAGDTTAFSTQWALYLLARNKIVQHEVRNDIKKNFDTKECELIRGTVREALRLYPVATFIGRILETEAIIGKFEIPKYTPVFLSMYTSGRDVRNFPNASKFIPSRWKRNSDGTLACVNHSTGTLPYALGARSCIGQKIANIQMHIILTEILRTFDLKLLNTSEIDVVMKMIAVPKDIVKIGIRKI